MTKLRFPSSVSALVVVLAGPLALAQEKKEQSRPELPPDTVWADQATDVKFSADVPIGSERVAEYPDIVAIGSRAWVAWVEYGDGGEHIRLAEVTRGEPSDAATISGSAEQVGWPRLASDGRERVWATWAAKGPAGYRIHVRQVFPDLAPSVELPVSASPLTASCFEPAIACAGDRVFVAWTEMTPLSSRIVAVSFVEPQAVAAPLVISAGGLAYRPTLAVSANDCWIAWDEVVDERQYEVFLARLGADRVMESIRVTRNPALDAAAALAVDDAGRVWLAWHSDRSAQRQWDLPKWPQLRCFDAGQWKQPPADLPAGPADPRGEDQGFEFPTLCCDPAGALWLFGRPSHGFNAVRLAGGAWSPVYRYPVPGWGGRGQYVRAAAVGSEVWTVRRDLHWIELCRIGIGAGDSADPTLGPLRDTLLPTMPAVAPPPDTFADPVIPSAAGAPRVLFGDVHMHTSLSDGMGTVDELYTRARRDYGLDFATVTDHDDFIGNRLLPSEWAYLQAVADLHDDPPHFATLCAFEWTDARYPKGDGHKNVYYRDHGPMLWHTDPEADDAPRLFAHLERAGGICFPHHIGWTGVNWETHHEQVQANVEICSVHGAYEYLNNKPIAPRGDLEGCFVQDGLAKGLRFGLVAGSDAHGLAWHHGIARRRNPWTQGLTAVYADEARRKAIWGALVARRCYATSGPKVYIDFNVAGQRAGGEVLVAEPPAIRAWIVAPVRIDQVALIRDGKAIYTSREDAETARLRHTDYEWSPGDGAKAYYYLRVILQNGEMAWSSPVFVDFTWGLVNTNGAAPVPSPSP